MYFSAFSCVLVRYFLACRIRKAGPFLTMCFCGFLRGFVRFLTCSPGGRHRGGTFRPHPRTTDPQSREPGKRIRVNDVIFVRFLRGLVCRLNLFLDIMGKTSPFLTTCFERFRSFFLRLGCVVLLVPHADGISDERFVQMSS